MKKMSLVLVLILSLTLVGVADDSEGQTPTKDGFKIKPKLFWSTVFPVIVNLDTSQWGITVFSLDSALFHYKNFSFLSVGGGLQTCYRQVFGYHAYYDYQRGYTRIYQGYGYKFLFEFYAKFVPVKYRWDWLSKKLKIDTYIELGFNPFEKEIFFGLSFSGNPFKKKKKEEKK